MKCDIDSCTNEVNDYAVFVDVQVEGLNMTVHIEPDKILCYEHKSLAIGKAIEKISSGEI